MVHVSGDLRIVTEDPSTVRHVIVRSPRARPHGDGMITGEPARFPVDNGRVEFEAAPGPVIVVLERMQDSGERFEGVVPEKEATTLRRVLEATVRYDPPVIHDAQAARDRAEAAAEQTAADRTQTGKDAAEAERQADIAVGSAQAASEDREQTGKDRQAAAKSADGAAASAKAASDDAAKTAADRTHVDGARAHIDSQVTHVNQVRGEVDSIATDFVDEATGISDNIRTQVDRSVEAADRIGTAEQVGEWSQEAKQAAGTAAADAVQSVEQRLDDKVTAAGNHETEAKRHAGNAGGHAADAKAAAEHVDSVAADAAEAVRAEVSDDADRADRAATRAEQHEAGAASAAAAEVDKLKGDAPEAFDTLEEIAEELAKNETERAALANSIGEKARREEVDAALGSKSDIGHGHEITDVDGLDTALAGAGKTAEWDQVSGKPTTFPPEGHRHTTGQIDNLDGLIRERVMAILREVPFLVMWDGEGEWVPGEWASIQQGVLNLDSSEIHSVVEKGEA